MALFGAAEENLYIKVQSTADTSGLEKSSGAIDRLNNTAGTGRSTFDKLQAAFLPVATLAASAGIAFDKLTTFLGSTIESSNRLNNSMLGLNSIADAFKQDSNKARIAAQDLASDGLMTVADAATGLKNLLAAGFGLDQAVILMKRFKDAAAFGRQGSLSFGQAITSATEGIKNGNSILVDNAGVTKNLSIMLTEAGYSANDLMKASTDAGVRQAIFNGILKETAPMLDNAAELAGTAAGQQAKMAAQSEVLKARIGEALTPALGRLLEVVTPMVEKFAKFVQDHPNVVAAVLIIGTVGLGLISVLGGIAVALMGLQPLFAVMSGVGTAAFGSISAAVGGSMGALGGLNGMLIGFAGWGLFLAAALAAFALIMNKLGEINRTIDNTNKALDTTDSALARARQQYQNGQISKERYNAILQGAYRAGGGNVMSGQPYIVGDNPDGSLNSTSELFVPNQSGRIYSAKDTRRILGEAAGGGNTVNYNAPIYLQTAEAVKEFFDIQERNSVYASKGLSAVRA